MTLCMHSRSVDPDAPLCAHSSQPHYLDFWQCLVPIADVASIAVSGPSTGRLGSDRGCERKAKRCMSRVCSAS